MGRGDDAGTGDRTGATGLTNEAPRTAHRRAAGVFVAARSFAAAALSAQRGHLFAWAPVCLGIGIALYFALPQEPAPLLLMLCAMAGALAVLVSARRRSDMAILSLAAGLVLTGVALAGARAHLVSGPTLEQRYYGPIEGRVVDIDRSASDVLRLTLDAVVLSGLEPSRRPERVRIALHGDPLLQARILRPAPGQRVMLSGHLLAPGGPVEPGGFDFRRHAWFQKIGAVGYTRSPVLLLEPARGGHLLFRTRMALSRHIQTQLPGEVGGFAAALMTGDRSAIGQPTLEALRRTNLAHLLAISGLHMGLLVGFVFGAVRLALLIPPRSRHHWPGKKLAAVVALVAAAGYLGLSGGNVATQRAFIMVAVMLGAVLADLRALSLRAVALAALLVLALRPEALLGPGFQMSFAATTALVRVFETLGARGHARLPGWGRPVFALLLSSITASFATAPISMAHFNLLSRYGLVANVLAVPAMGLLAMPMAVMSALLLPLGLEAVALQVMAVALRWILGVAEEVSGWSGSAAPVVAPGLAVLPLLALGGLFIVLWRGRARWCGLAPVLCGALLWVAAERPLVLIAESGTLVGVMTEEGRALSRARGAGFVAKNWLAHDGQAGGQGAAAALWPGDDGPLRKIAQSGHVIGHLSGTRAAQALSGCGGAEIIVSSVPLRDLEGCTVFDPARLRQSGSVAFYRVADGLRMKTSYLPARRLWQPRVTAARGDQ